MHQQPWPQWSEDLAVEDALEIEVQVNGNLRDRITVPVDANEATVGLAVKDSEKAGDSLDDKQIRKLIYIPGKLVNFVVS